MRTAFGSVLIFVLLGSAAPLPDAKYGGHRFAPIDPKWSVTTCLLKPDDIDPCNSYTVVESGHPEAAGCLKSMRYFEKDDMKARRIVTFYPSGRRLQEIDNIGKENHSRSWAENGKEMGYLHWSDGKWVNGWSVGPWGERHQLKNGNGERVKYGLKEGNRVHTWYARGHIPVEKRFRDGKVIEVRLNGSGPFIDWLIVTPEDESHWDSGGLWRRPAGLPAKWVNFADGRLIPPPPRTYAETRADFLKRFGKQLDAAGLSWDKLGIDFIRADKAWPK